MKHLLIYILINFLIVLNTFAQNVDNILVYEEPFSSEIAPIQTTIKQRSKTIRLKSDVGTTNIVANIESDVKNLNSLAPEIIQNAVKLWREQLSFAVKTNVVTINFHLYDNLGSNIAYKFENSYIEHTDGIRYPLALAQAKFGYIPQETDVINIYFSNNPAVWYFEGDQQAILSGQFDFKTAVLRALTQVFGFKSSLTNKTRPQFMAGLRYCYDYQVINTDNIILASRTSEGTQSNTLTSFATGNNVYWKTPNTGYKIYAPITFLKDLTLNFFDSQNELMSYSFKANQGIWDIDDKVLQVMSDIGWTLNEKNFNISSDQIGSNGIGSIYESYTFNATAQTGAVTNQYWEYRIKKTDGTYSLISSSSTPTFTINPQSVSSLYERNSDGDIIVEIYLKGKVNGIEHETTINLYMECEPSDLTYSIKINRLNQWECNAEVTLISKGATDFQMTVRDWEAETSFTTAYEGTQYIKATTYNLLYDSPIRFQFRSSNQYGIKTLTYNMSPVSYIQTQAINLASPVSYIPTLTANNPLSYEVYTTNGILVKRVTTKANIKDGTVYPGFYIVRAINASGNIIETNKIIVTK